MRTDVNYSHYKNIREQVGEFCGTPIRLYDPFDLELDDALDVQNVRLRNQAMGCSDSPSTAEVLPGEVVCPDNIIRRKTTVEAGRNMSKAEYGSESLASLCSLYAITSDPMNQRGYKSQSTPEELCAWLNAQENCSFKHEVVTKEDSKAIIAMDSKGVLVYTFHYMGGLPSTYNGGDEVRPFTSPQVKQDPRSPSRVVECYVPATEPVHREPVDVKEWQDEWENDYVPTSHPERITIGGTALFGESNTKEGGGTR